MAKKKLKLNKPKTGKDWKQWFSWLSRKDKRASRQAEPGLWKHRLKIAAMSIFLPLLPAAMIVGFFYLEKYVHQVESQNLRIGTLVFVHAPAWAHSEAMKSALSAAAGGTQFVLDEKTARQTAETLAAVTWLYDVQVKADAHNVLIEARYREPLAKIKTAAGKEWYVGKPAPDDPLCGDENGVVILESLSIQKPPLVEIVNFNDKNLPSAAGKVWLSPDVRAALHLLAALEEMDKKVCAQKPLTEQLTAIDIANYDGRQSASQPHIVLHTKYGKQIYWGAAFGKASSTLEASETEKLTKLYTFYSQELKYKLDGPFQYIDLLRPQMGIPRPQ